MTDLRHPEQCQAYLRAYEKALETPPTDEHLSLLKRMAGISHNAHTIESLANNLHITQAEAEIAYTAALASIGIFATHASARSVQTRMYFAARKPHIEPMTPITPKQWEALRMFANGADADAIRNVMGFTRNLYADQLIKDICNRLGIRARGRGVQRKLAATAIAYHEALEDPFF